VVVGVWVLLYNLGVLPAFSWGIFGPVILILIGLSLLLGRGRGGEHRRDTVSVPLEGATSATVVFKHGAGKLRVSAGAPTDPLVAGTFVGGLDPEVTRHGGAVEVTLRTPSHEWGAWAFPWNWWGRDAGFDWDVTLNPGPVLTLTFETGAGEGRLDLSALRVADLVVKTGASSTALVTPSAAGFTRAHISSGAAALEITVPSGVAAHVSGALGLGTMKVDERRFPRRDGAYESSDYAGSANRIEMLIEGGLGAVSVH
jgi:hypothetical protein